MSLDIVVWDVKHGNAVYARTPNGKHIVCDLGVGSYEGDNEVFSPLTYLIDEYAVKQLDYVVISHPHKDHLSDIFNFDKLSPKAFCRPKYLKKEDILKGVKESDKPLFEKYFEISDSYNQAITDNDSDNPKNPDNFGGVKIETFTPRDCDVSNLNNHSIVTVLSYAQSKIIIPGDCEPPAWEELLKRQEFIASIKNADILLAPHHGRDSGFCPEIFEHFKPYLTVISDGKYTNTSATDKYCNVTKGWNVSYRKGGNEKRQCVSTRNDGCIKISFRYNDEKVPTIGVTARGS